MGIRRERPPAEREGGQSIRLRFPDGTVKAMPGRGQDRGAASDVCCFCGEPVGQPEADAVDLSARWSEGGQVRTRSLRAHRSCFAERTHDSVPGDG